MKKKNKMKGRATKITDKFQNNDLVKQFFNERDATAIFKIPLNLLTQEDARIWKNSKRGVYTVRSAYITNLWRILLTKTTSKNRVIGINFGICKSQTR
jgi:hypothetical protein